MPADATGVERLRWLWGAGHAVLPLDPAAPPDHRQALLERLRPARLVTDEHPDGTALPDPRPVPDDAALVVATSGSTGTPKGVVLSDAALAASTAASLDRLGCRPGQSFGVPLPLHHVAGVQALRRSWALGTGGHVLPPGDPTAWAAAGADHLALVPTQLARALAAGVPPPPGVALLGGAAAAPDLLERARAAGWRVVTSYGMTETCGGCVYDGQPLAGVEVALRPDGRVRVRGALLATGYLGDETPLTDADGWFTTGDVGRATADGRLEVVGRADDVVVSGGENVPLAAVTAALADHPEVAEVAALGAPDPTWGEVVVAVVVPRDPAAPPDLDALRDHVRARHPVAYAPRELVVVDELPRDAMGKVTLAALRR
ncbi:AMP-binding protein [Nitriliruptoraceae bacterium ZYF776]|nr:AMP-binding protein [Profundirhabdus halotolerans]